MILLIERKCASAPAQNQNHGSNPAMAPTLRRGGKDPRFIDPAQRQTARSSQNCE